MRDNKIVSYSEIKDLRRSSRMENFIPPVLTYKQNHDGSYVLFLPDKSGTSYEALTQNQEEIDDFELNVKAMCGKSDLPTGKLIKTHDFSDNSTWVNGSSNSLYIIAPAIGKEYKILKFNGKVGTNVQFGANQQFHISIWEGITLPCPAATTTKTIFADVLYDPENQIYTGWYKAYPPQNDTQEVDVWLYFENNIMRYKVTDFKFSSLDEFKDKGEYTVEDNVLRVEYPYSKYGIYLMLRSSMNERIEIYTSDDNEVDAQLLSGGIRSIMSAVISEYDEW